MAELLASGRAAMVQPYLPSIAERGETALIFFGGVYSHAIHKGPMLPETGIVRPYGMFQPENIAAREPTSAERVAGEPVVLECELAEPSLFLGTAPGAADRLAACLAEQIC